MTSSPPESNDVEKGFQLGSGEVSPDGHHQHPVSTGAKLGSYLQRFEDVLVKYNLETRGIQRVEPHECHDVTWKNYVQASLMWCSVNLVAINITLGMLAPTVFYLSFKDASLCAVFGSFLGSLAVAYITTWGPVSGNRTMILARYTFGWWPSKLIVILNLVVILGYSMVDLVVAGQILSAVSPNNSLSLVVGIIITALITWLVTTFGISLFHIYQRYAVLPQLIAICIFYGVASPHFDLTTPTAGNSTTVAASRLSFFSLCLAAAITYSGEAADYFVYYSPSTPRLSLFLSSLLGLITSFTLAILLGIGLASGLATTASYKTAYETYGQGALIVTGLSDPLGSFGKFLAVVIALGLIANAVLPTYSAGIDFQILSTYFERIPRVIWNTAGVIIYTVCALAGRDHLSVIFINFLELMGYWVAIWIAITIEEQVIFRRPWGKVQNSACGGGYDWTAWNERARLPYGIAALTAFLVGWVGAILCMAQVYYVGPIAGLVGEHGADMGNYVGFTWAALVYPPLRWAEKKYFGR